MSSLRALVWDAIRQADHILLILCVTANCYGILLIYSASRWKVGWHSQPFKQALAMGIGIVLYFVMTQVNLENLMSKWKWIIAGCTVLFLLLLVPHIGVSAGGNRAWLHIPGIPFNLQPAEIVKLFFTMLLAYLTLKLKKQGTLNHPVSIIKMGVLLVYFFGIIVGISRDFGSALIYIFIFVFVLWGAGVSKWWFALGIACACAGGAVLWRILPDDNTQKARIMVCLDHDLAPMSTGFQQNRSILAIRSGGLTGQGFLNGTCTQSISSGALSERSSDFIFSSCAEEWGLVGCSVILLLLALIILRCLYIAATVGSPFASLVAVGYSGMLVAQVGLNVGMCLYVMPVIGLTLPFFSYGGSSIITMYVAMGILSGVRAHSVPGWIKDSSTEESAGFEQPASDHHTKPLRGRKSRFGKQSVGYTGKGRKKGYGGKLFK